MIGIGIWLRLGGSGGGGGSASATSYSAGFPEENLLTDSGYAYFAPDVGSSSHFDADSTLVVALGGIPWRMLTVKTVEEYYILGNDDGTTPGNGQMAMWVVNTADDGGFEIHFAITNGSGTVTQAFDLGANEYSDLVVAVRSDSGDLGLDLFRHGSKLATAPTPVAFTGTALTGESIAIGAGGANGGAPDGGTNGFFGDLAFVGYTDELLSDANLQAISEGQDISGIGTAANWRWVGQWEQSAETPAFVTPSWATGAISNSWAVSGGSLRPGGTVLPAYTA